MKDEALKKGEEDKIAMKKTLDLSNNDCLKK